jgi:uncharacterized protein
MIDRNKVRCFPVGIAEELGSYVYLYYDPRALDEPFYIGKGGGVFGNDRIFAHLVEAEDETKTSEKVKKIREIWQAGHDVSLVVHRHGMSESEAENVEASLIEIFPETLNEVEGKGTSVRGARLIEELISEKTRRKAEICFPAVIINIRKEWLRVRESQNASVDQQKLYLATRTAWAVKPKNHPNVEYAISAAFGLIRQVYKINRWRPADINADGTPRPLDERWMFDGEVAVEKAELIGQAIDHLQKTGAQNPIRWWDPDGRSREQLDKGTVNVVS